MKNITKQEALEKIEELKKYVDEVDKEEKVVGIEIKTALGRVLFKSTKTTIKEAVVEAVNSGANLRDANLRGANLSDADLSDADLSGADLRGANLRGAEMQNVKFYGKTNNPKTLTKKQLPDFLKALGFIIQD